MKRLSRFAARPEKDKQRVRIAGYAETMRKEMTSSEARLWEFLRSGYPTPYHTWVSQKNLAQWYIVDFFCPRKRLIVEVDGMYHETDFRRLKDQQRDSILRSAGNRVVRVTNDDVWKHMDDVLATIRRELGVKAGDQ